MIDPIERRDKQLLTIHRELRTLHRNAYVTVQLEQPTIWGWIRYYRVAEKIGAHQDREMLEHILRIIGTQRWSKTPEFKVWRGKRRKKKRFVNLEQPLRTIPASKWERAKYPEEWKRYFRVELTRHKRLWHPSYVFAHRGLFELAVRPQIVTELQVPDLEVHAKIRRLNRWLTQRNLMHRLDRLLGISKWWQTDERRTRLLERLARHEMRTAKFSYPEVDPASNEIRCPINLRIVYAPTVQNSSTLQSVIAIMVHFHTGALLEFPFPVERHPNRWIKTAESGIDLPQPL